MVQSSDMETIRYKFQFSAFRLLLLMSLKRFVAPHQLNEFNHMKFHSQFTVYVQEIQSPKFKFAYKINISINQRLKIKNFVNSALLYRYFQTVSSA